MALVLEATKSAERDTPDYVVGRPRQDDGQAAAHAQAGRCALRLADAAASHRRILFALSLRDLPHHAKAASLLAAFSFIGRLMSYTIFGDKGSGAFSAEAVLAEAGAPYEFHLVSLEKNEQRKPEFLAINPSGKMPALRLPEGEVITESAAILLTIADHFPNARLLPPQAGPARAQAYRWLAFMAAEIYPMVEVSDYPERFAPARRSGRGACARRRANAFASGLLIVERFVAGPWFLAVAASRSSTSTHRCSRAGAAASAASGWRRATSPSSMRSRREWLPVRRSRRSGPDTSPAERCAILVKSTNNYIAEARLRTSVPALYWCGDGRRIPMVSRRTMIVGGAGAALIAGLGYRIWDRGVFSGPQGAAYAPWDEWRGSIVDGIEQPLRAAILAANPHDTQPWLFEAARRSPSRSMPTARAISARSIRSGARCIWASAPRSRIWCAPRESTATPPMCRPSPGGSTTSPGPKTHRRRAYHDGSWRTEPRSVVRGDSGSPHQSRASIWTSRWRRTRLRGLADLVSVGQMFASSSSSIRWRARTGATLIVDATQRIIDDPQMSADSAHWIRTGRRDSSSSIATASRSMRRAFRRYGDLFGKFMPDLAPHSTDSYWLANTRDTQVHAPGARRAARQGPAATWRRRSMPDAPGSVCIWLRRRWASPRSRSTSRSNASTATTMLGRPDTYQNALVQNSRRRRAGSRPSSSAWATQKSRRRHRRAGRWKT